MAAPHEIRNQTRSDLWKALQAMMTPEWDLSLIGKPASVVQEAGVQFLQIQRSRVRLGTQELEDIRDSLKENEDALKEGGENMKEALEDLEQVEQVLATAAAFLGVIGAVVDLAT